jgi:hypothetical protein
MSQGRGGTGLAARLRSRRGRNERGVALVEAAFIFPVLALLVFGSLEFGLLFKDYLTVANMSRAGARIGAADGSTQVTDYDILQAVKASGNAVPSASIKAIVVFKASAGTSSLPNVTCETASVTNVCNFYTSADFTRPKTDFNCVKSPLGSGTGPDRFWYPCGRVDTQSGNSGAGPDYVGVYVRYDHKWMTGLFGSTKTISDTTVMRIEPVS